MILVMLVVKDGHQKDMCYNERGLYAQDINTDLSSLVSTIEKNNLHCDLLSNCETRNNNPCDLSRQFLIQSSGQNCSWSWKCPQQGRIV